MRKARTRNRKGFDPAQIEPAFTSLQPLARFPFEVTKTRAWQAVEMGGKGAGGSHGAQLAQVFPEASSCAAASTSAAWPLTFTLRHSRAMRPSASMRNVERSMPIYVRPYMDFSTQTP